MLAVIVTPARSTATASGVSPRLQLARKEQNTSVAFDLAPTPTAAFAPAGGAAGVGGVEKYARLLRMGMPDDQVRLKMERDGVDPSLLPEVCGNSAASRLVNFTGRSGLE